MPKRFCGHCGQPFDMATAPGQLCPACRAKANARPSSAKRGYGASHKKLRAKLIAKFQPGQACARCGKPIWTKQDAQLGHDDKDRTRYRGLEHVRCNEATSTRR